MPIVINEIVFKATISEPGRPLPASAAPAAELSSAQIEQVVRAAVAEVLRILQQEAER